MDYICTFLVYLIEMLQKHYHQELRKGEVTLPSRNGCRNTNLKEYLLKEKGFLSSKKEKDVTHSKKTKNKRN